MNLRWPLGVGLVLFHLCHHATICPAASILDTSGGGTAANGFLQFSGGDALYGDPSLSSVINGFGQTFRVAGSATVTSVTVWLDNNDPWENVINFRTGQRWNDPAEMYAYIAEWDASTGALKSGSTAGAAVLHQSGLQEATSPGLASYTFSMGGGLQLDPNKQYVALFSGLSPNGSAFDGRLGFGKVLAGANGFSNNESAVFFRGGSVASFSDLTQLGQFMTDARDIAISINGIVSGVVPPDPGPQPPPTGLPEPWSVFVWACLGVSGMAAIGIRRRR